MSRSSQYRSRRGHRPIIFLLAAPLALAAAACGGAESSGEAPVAFDDPHPGGARLTVVEFEGGLGVSVTAPVGVPVPSGNGLSLIELYRRLHPQDIGVPRELEALSARAEALMRSQVVRPSTATLPPVAIDKSEADFRRLTCVTIEEGDNRYTPRACVYRTSAWSANVPAPSPCSGWGCYPVSYGDRSFAWNENAFNTSLTWYNSAILPHPHWTILPYHWGWYTAFGSDHQSFGVQHSTFPLNVNGRQGVTWHDHSLRPPR